MEGRKERLNRKRGFLEKKKEEEGKTITVIAFAVQVYMEKGTLAPEHTKRIHLPPSQKLVQALRGEEK